MKKSLNVIDEIRISTPCPKNWHAMQGDERRRYCSHCSMHVTNLSEHTQEQALKIVSQAGTKRLCVRILVGASGKVIYKQSSPWWKRSLQAPSILLVALLTLIGLSTSKARAETQKATSDAQGEQSTPFTGERKFPFFTLTFAMSLCHLALSTFA